MKKIVKPKRKNNLRESEITNKDGGFCESEIEMKRERNETTREAKTDRPLVGQMDDGRQLNEKWRS